MERGCVICGTRLTSALAAHDDDDDDDGSQVEEPPELKEAESSEGEEEEEEESEEEDELTDEDLPHLEGEDDPPRSFADLSDLSPADRLAMTDRMKAITGGSTNFALTIDETALSNFTSNSNNPKC